MHRGCRYRCIEGARIQGVVTMGTRELQSVFRVDQQFMWSGTPENVCMDNRQYDGVTGYQPRTAGV